jgi:SAM-dependent methyltransferase
LSEAVKNLLKRLKRQPVVPLPEQLPYPVDIRRRDYKSEGVRRHGGLEVFDAPNAVAINRARITNLASMGLAFAGKRVLDIGCGVGHLGARLAEMGANVVCVDGRESNIASLRMRYPQLEAHVGNVETDDLAQFGRFPIVFCYGLLYHLENPLQSLRSMAAVCDEMLLLETIICDHEMALVRVEDESTDVNQALGGIAGRPTPHYVVLALNRVGFPFVYAPVTPPEHEDFHFEWRNNLDCARDGHNLRCTFVASRTELKNPALISLLRD